MDGSSLALNLALMDEGEVVVDGEKQEAASDVVPTEAKVELATAFTDFHGRKIEVRVPTPEQIVIIRRLEKIFTEASKDTDSLSAERAVKLMDRALTVILAIVVSLDDKEFIEDLWLSGDMTLPDTLPLIRSAMKRLQEVNADQQNRAGRRADGRKSGKKSGSAGLVTS